MRSIAGALCGLYQFRPAHLGIKDGTELPIQCARLERSVPFRLSVPPLVFPIHQASIALSSALRWAIQPDRRSEGSTSWCMKNIFR